MLSLLTRFLNNFIEEHPTNHRPRKIQRTINTKRGIFPVPAIEEETEHRLNKEGGPKGELEQ